MRLSANSIDLIETQKAFESKYKGYRLSRDKFGLQVIKAAHEAIGKYGLPARDLAGIKRMLIAMTGNLMKRHYLWIVPLATKPVFARGPFGALWESENVEVLVDSLLATIIKYQKSLWEFETNLAQILLYEITCGFECHCDWISRGIPIEPEKNDLIRLVNVDEINSKLEGGYAA